MLLFMKEGVHLFHHMLENWSNKVWDHNYPCPNLPLPKSLKLFKNHNCLLNKGHEVIVEPASKRAFSDIEFEKEGAKINSDLSGCDVILGVKQIPIESLVDDSTSVFFSHTIKVKAGQDHLSEIKVI